MAKSTKGSEGSPAHYPYVWAWGYQRGGYEDTIRKEAELAVADGAPNTAIYRSDWVGLDPEQRTRALVDEKAGRVAIARDKRGEPVRVWWLWESIAGTVMAGEVQKKARSLADEAGRGNWR